MSYDKSKNLELGQLYEVDMKEANSDDQWVVDPVVKERRFLLDAHGCWKLGVTALAVLCSVLLCVNIVLVSGSNGANSNPVVHFECLYAVGGGSQSNTGGFPQTRAHSEVCTNAILDYTADGGQYWEDLAEAGQQALVYYQNWINPTSKQMLVFDIDETSVSNIREMHERPSNNLDNSYVFNSTSWHEFINRGTAPAIQPILAVYSLAYKRGMSVAFITGRAEPSREATLKNLELAGYGVQCEKDEDGNVIRTEEPCFIALHLRGDDDMDKLASEYKPERRFQMMADGYEIVGSFGDQISDLNGAFPAHASWKLPNPMYYIL